MHTGKRVIKICRIGLFASLMALGAWISIPLPIPITLQTFVLFLMAGALPVSEALGACAVYLALGAVGLPVFAGFNAGISTFFGPSGGFLIGFIPAVLVMALLGKNKNGYTRRAFITFLAVSILYICGCLWYTLVYGGDGVIGACVLPFLPVDLIKAAIAIPLCARLKKHVR